MFDAWPVSADFFSSIAHSTLFHFLLFPLVTGEHVKARFHVWHAQSRNKDSSNPFFFF